MRTTATFWVASTLAYSVALGVCPAQAAPPPVDQVSADCTSPVYATDHLVCADASLRALDAEMLRIWHMAEARHRLDGAERVAQVEWFRARSLCAFKSDHRACVVSAYNSRIAALLALLGGE